MNRILIIDDQKYVREAITLALKTRGFDVTAVENAAAGLREFEASRFDLAIVDVFMPGMDGVQLIKALRAGNQSFPVIAISGVELGVSQRTVLDYLPRAPGLSDIICLQKPFRPSQLLQAIENAMTVVA